MKTISYNLRKNRAGSEVTGLAVDHDADILCLQEADTKTLSENLAHLKLITHTVNNRLGLAIYAREDRFIHHTAKTFSLKKSMHDRILQPANERLVGAKLFDHDTGRDLVVASFHAAPLTALNSLRRAQIHAALEELKILGSNTPILMVGDYNYPVFKERLGLEMQKSGYELTISDKRTYTRYKMFRGHFDFATSQGFDITKVKTLARGTSDHLPILVQSFFNDLVPLATP